MKLKEYLDKMDFAEKNKSKEITVLSVQSTKSFKLIKKNSTKQYFIKRVKDSKTILIGDRDKSEDFILYGLFANRNEVKQLFNS
jgi:hypothetical protein